DQRQRAAYLPADAIDVLDDGVALIEQQLSVLRIAGGDQQLGRRTQTPPFFLRLGAFVDRDRGLERTLRQIVVVTFQCPRRRRERGGGQQFTARILLGEYPAIVRRTRQSHRRRARLRCLFRIE